MQVPAYLPADARETAELVILFTKAHHTEAALAAAGHLIGPETWVFGCVAGNYIKSATGSLRIALAGVAAIYLVAMILALWLKRGVARGVAEAI